MSVRIRLKRMGSKKRPFYRIIATDSRMPRDGRFIENMGYYNPMTNPPDIHVDEEKLFKWFERGATPTEGAAGLLRRVGSLQKWGLKKAGLTGEELEMKVEAIKNQRLAAAQRKELKRGDAKSQKVREKEAAEAEAEAKAETQAEAEAKTKAETKTETQAEAEAKTKAETKTETQAEAEAKTKAETKTETQAEAGAEAQAESPVEEVPSTEKDASEASTEEPQS